MDITDKILEVVSHLDYHFWTNWQDITSNFPDTDEGDNCKLLCAQAGIHSIIANYLLGFPSKKRSYYLELMINRLRAIELQIREIEE